MVRTKKYHRLAGCERDEVIGDGDIGLRDSFHPKVMGVLDLFHQHWSASCSEEPPVCYNFAQRRNCDDTLGSCQILMIMAHHHSGSFD